jgi:hypothetical protein
MKNKSIIYLVIISIFLFLFSCAKGKFDLQIDGNKEAIGADVYINGSYSGKMKVLAKDGSYYSILLQHGTHVIEIKKRGYYTYRESINVEDRGEHYLFIELKREKTE